MAEHNELGRKGEQLAAQWLIQNGYEIIAKNLRIKRYEIDLLCKKNNMLIVVEVKCRHSDTFQFPEQSVDQKKQQNLIRAIELYRLENQINLPVRFDVIAVVLQSNRSKIRHFEDAFYPFDF